MLYLHAFYRSLPPEGGGGGEPPVAHTAAIQVTATPGCHVQKGAFLQVVSRVFDELSRNSTSSVLVYSDAGRNTMVGFSNSVYVNGSATDTVYLPTGGKTYYLTVYGEDTTTYTETVVAPACATDPPPPPNYPVSGTFLRNACNGTTLQKVVADGAGGEKWGGVVAYNSAECGYIPPTPTDPVLGCTNPEALNYNPLATTDNGTCVFPERLLVTLPAALAVVGNPVEVKLASGPTGRTASRAVAILNTGQLAEGSEVNVNGSVFRFSLTPKGDEFYDAQTLAQALQEDIAVAQGYEITQPQPTQVRLEALQPGSAYTPVVSSAGGIAATITQGIDALRSQTKREWGCYVEIWACSGTYGQEAGKDNAVLLQRLERLYAPGNSYTFGLEATLRRNLRHGLFTEGDRMQAYFVRVGETFVPEGQVQPVRYPIAESDVLWALEGALPYQTPNEVFTPLLLNQIPGTLDTPLHGFFYAEALYALVKDGAALGLEAKFVDYTGTETQESFPIPVPQGGVTKVPLAPVFAKAQQLNAASRLLRCEATLKATLGTATTTLGTVRYSFTHQTPQSRCLVFSSSLSAYEAIWTQGMVQHNSKRSLSTYSRGMAGINTVSGRSRAVGAVVLEETLRLSTSLLGKATYDYLRRELAASPDVYVFDPRSATYAAANIIGMEAKADELNEEYYLTFDLEPGVPHNPLRN